VFKIEKNSVKSIRKRLEQNEMEPYNIDFDEVEYSIERKTSIQDNDWDKKIQEQELYGYNEENWHEGDYERKLKK